MHCDSVNRRCTIWARALPSYLVHKRSVQHHFLLITFVFSKKYWFMNVKLMFGDVFPRLTSCRWFPLKSSLALGEKEVRYLGIEIEGTGRKICLYWNLGPCGSHVTAFVRWFTVPRNDYFDRKERERKWESESESEKG